jgi:hypothetical protein
LLEFQRRAKKPMKDTISDAEEKIALLKEFLELNSGVTE